MGILRKTVRTQNYNQANVAYQDTTLTSEVFNVGQLPSTFPIGKSAFTIAGSTLLRPKIKLQIELLDGDGNAIYIEPVKANYNENFIYVSVEVYDTTKSGEGTITILGELSEAGYTQLTGQSLPSGFIGTYNVKWVQPIVIDVTEKNTQPIRFYKQPKIDIFEDQGFYTETNDPAPVTQSVNVKSNPPQHVLSKIYTPTEIELIRKNSRVSTLRELIGGGSSHIQQVSDEPLVNYPITRVQGNADFSSRHIGQNIQIGLSTSDIKEDLESYEELETNYTSSIVRVDNKDTAYPLLPPFAVDTRNGNRRPVSIKFTKIASVISQDIGTPTAAGYNVVSYVDLRLNSIRTFSGEVNRVKVYMRSAGSTADFEQIYDSPLESGELFNDDTIVGDAKRLGWFYSKTHLNNKFSFQIGSEDDPEDINPGSTDPYFPVTSSVYLTDAVNISGSNADTFSNLKFQNSTLMDFKGDTDYVISANVYVKQGKKIGAPAHLDGEKGSVLEFRISGSAFQVQSNNVLKHYGQRVMQMSSGLGQFFTPNYPESLPPGTNQGYAFGGLGKVTATFRPNSDGNGKLSILSRIGSHHISDVSIKPLRSDGFSPNFYRTRIPVPHLLTRPDSVTFLVEFYDKNNNIADVTIVSEPKTFEGPNLTIEGTDNVLSGSMFLGDASGSGIEQSGTNSGLIRSIGYQGFASASMGSGSGFLLYSGSVLPESGDNYDGVGLELHDGVSGSMRFRTDLGVFEVNTPAFFLGSNSQFVSGSNGNIEISSSDFHLTTDGDVTASKFLLEGGRITGDVTIEASLTANSISTPTGAATPSASISADGLASFVSASIGGFDVSAQGLTVLPSGPSPGEYDPAIDLDTNNRRIAINPSNSQGTSYGDTGIQLEFNSGNPRAFIGKSNAGFMKFDDGILEISSSAFILGKVGDGGQFISGSNGNVEISSSNFHLSASGDVVMAGEITAQSGEIAGYTIGTGKLTVGDSPGVNISGSGVIVAGDITDPGGQAAAYFGVLRENGGTSGVSASLFDDVGEPVPGLGNGTFTGGTHLGFQVDAGNYFKLVNSEPQFRVGDRGQENYIGYDGGEQVLTITSSVADIRFSETYDDSHFRISGSDVRLSAPRFYLGGNTQYISGSNGFIEVSSSNIHIERDGNLTVRRVTANDGFIGGSGGFGIKDSLLHSPASAINSPISQPPPNQLNFETGGNKTGRRFAILADYTGSFGYYMIDAGIDGDQIAVAMMSASTKTTEDDDGAVTAHSELGFYGQGDAKSIEGKEQKVYRKMIVSAITPETTPSCFLKNTMITMADGSELPIQDIEVGMRVLSYNEDLDDVVASKVTEVFYHPAEHTDEYFIINDKIFVTGNHEIYTPNDRYNIITGDVYKTDWSKWLRVDRMQVDDVLVDSDLVEHKVESIEKIIRTPIETWNLEVENTHTYFAEGYIVHNGAPASPSGKNVASGEFSTIPVRDEYNMHTSGSANNITGAREGDVFGHKNATMQIRDIMRVVSQSVVKAAAHTLVSDHSGSIFAVGDRNITNLGAKREVSRSYAAASTLKGFFVQKTAYYVERKTSPNIGNATFPAFSAFMGSFGSGGTSFGIFMDEPEAIIRTTSDHTFRLTGLTSLQIPRSLASFSDTTDQDYQERWRVGGHLANGMMYYREHDNSLRIYEGGWLGETFTFTGAHHSLPNDNDINHYTASIDRKGDITDSDYRGKIVVASDGYMYKNNIENKDAIMISQAWTKVNLSTTHKDKKVYGVISDYAERESGSDMLVVNAVGEGGIWICDASGSFENGDYITTSKIPGYGCKQDDDLLHNYTVAKITNDCNFESGSQYITGSVTHDGVEYKTAFIGCTYHCG